MIEAPRFGGRDARFPDAGGEAPSDPGGRPGFDQGAEAALQEADIIQLQGNRLYALSSRGGLTIIDVSRRDALHVLGRYRQNAEPFEMYVQGDRVFVMFRGFGQYLYEPGFGYGFRTDSRLVSLDVSDPNEIVPVGETELPGTIQDSRRKADVLYVVTHEDGYCYGCESTPRTTVTSFDISDLSELRQIDQLRFEIEAGSYTGGQRSVYSTAERMYVAGPVWDQSGGDRSIIEVVDISDADGALARGATLQAAGEIRSRWQLDEHEGTLRVLSQPVAWSGMQAPVLETFTVASALDFQALGSMELQLPRPESLRSVRFDGDRAYAITFQQTDPLFTLDLSDPAQPRQVGELELPGFIHHMLPLGDRLLGFGFDVGNTQGSINASLFDVTDLESPALLSRVDFGGDWADFAEDQNRIHKSLALLAEQSLLLVPFSGWDQDEACGVYRSGVQLIDFSRDQLTLRGLAGQTDRSRRSFVRDERLFAVSDSAVQTYDIADRDEPVQTAAIDIASNAQRGIVAGDHFVRLASRWTTGTTELQVLRRDDPDGLEPLGTLVLDDVLERTAKPGVPEPLCQRFGLHDVQLFARDGFVYLLYQDYGPQTAATRLATVGLDDPAALELVHTLALPFPLGSSSGYYLAGAVDAGRNALQVGSALVLHRSEIVDDGRLPRSHARFELVDLSDPALPRRGGSFDRGEALGHGQLLVFGTRVIASSVQAIDPDGTSAAFFVDRLELDGDAAPQLLARVNVPGPVIAHDPASERAVAFEYEYETRPEREAGACYQEPKTVGYDYDQLACTLLHQRLSLIAIEDGRATRLGSLDVEGERRVLHAVGTTELVFAQVGEGFSYWYPDVVVPPALGDVAGEAPIDVAIGHDNLPIDLVTVTGLGSGEIEEASRYETTFEQLDLYRAQTQDHRLVVPSYGAGLVVFDASTPDDPELSVHELYGYYCQDLSLTPSTAYCALGDYGVQAVPLPE